MSITSTDEDTAYLSVCV